MSEDATTTRRAANLFDLRRIIGGLSIVYGIVLFVLLFESQEEIDRAAGWNVKLWTGVGMLVFGALMMLWASRARSATSSSRARKIRSGRRRAASTPRRWRQTR